MKESLTPAQEAEAQQLADLIAAASREDFLRLARLLVTGGAAPFGDTEFKVRDTVLAIGARALETALRQKKTATTAAASPAPTAAKRPPTTTSGRAPS